MRTPVILVAGQKDTDPVVGVEALTVRLVAAHAGAVPLVAAVSPPTADLVSVQSVSVAGLSAAGGEHTAVARHGVEELGRSGVGVGESGTSYAIGDGAAASSHLTASGLR